MAKPQRRFSESTTSKRLKERRGEGRGVHYRPWLLIHDVPSMGRVTREKGQKTGRVHHFLSDLERDYFFIQEWSTSVIDIREQFPLLPLEETLAIADECNIGHPSIRHPKKPEIQIPVVMTTDFVITIADGLIHVDKARTIKYSNELQSKRTLEKLEIERRYWAKRNTDWKIVTEREISRIFAQNVKLMHKYVVLEDRLSLPEEAMYKIVTTMTFEAMKNTLSLRTIASACDMSFQLEPGTCLTIAYHLLATKQWQIDMSIPFHPGQIFRLSTMRH